MAEVAKRGFCSGVEVRRLRFPDAIIQGDAFFFIILSEANIGMHALEAPHTSNCRTINSNKSPPDQDYPTAPVISTPLLDNTICSSILQSNARQF